LRDLKNKVMRGVAWRISELKRNAADATGAFRYGIIRKTGSLTVTFGSQKLGVRLALYAIYPQAGVQISHLEALRALRNCGYATLVVSNLPLSERELAMMRDLVWKVIQRPNFGYDFGAYKEGIHQIESVLPRLDRLILLNDSVWFPLPGGQDWPLKAEALGVDFVGAVSNCGFAPPKNEDFVNYSLQYDPKLPDFHYCSFALSFGPKALSNPAFVRFWKHIRLTDNKFHTVLRGEVSLSRCLIAAGLSHAETMNNKSLGEYLAALPATQLLHFVENLAIPEDDRLEEIRKHTVNQPDRSGQHQRLLETAFAIVALTGPAYAMPAFAYDALKHPFLKKSPLRLSRTAAEATLRLTARLPEVLGASIHDEAVSLAKARFGEEIFESN
jgi:hypothetical protein